MLALSRPMESTDKIIVGRRITALRKTRDYKGALLAKLIDISPQQLSNYEVGRDMVSPATAYKIASHFGVSLDFLYAGKFNGMPPELAEKLVDSLNALDPAKTEKPVRGRVLKQQ